MVIYLDIVNETCEEVMALRKQVEENEKAMETLQQSYEEKLAAAKETVTKLVIFLEKL